MLPFRSLRPLLRRTVQARTQATYQAPTPPRSQQPNPHRNFYKQFGRPVIKNFLVAVMTYQVLYYSWMYLEAGEVQEQKGAEIKALEGEIKGLSKAGKKT
ncbi:hypothetical protein LTR08_009069 [Meristemomyces frigidus]|nr:hypothetical protein LTR08_009069 [Meristemomyces frigidus]